MQRLITRFMEIASQCGFLCWEPCVKISIGGVDRQERLFGVFMIGQKFYLISLQLLKWIREILENRQV